MDILVKDIIYFLIPGCSLRSLLSMQFFEGEVSNLVVVSLPRFRQIRHIFKLVLMDLHNKILLLSLAN